MKKESPIAYYKKDDIFNMCGEMALALDTKEGWTYYYLECSTKKTRAKLITVLAELNVMYLKKHHRGGF